MKLRQKFFIIFFLISAIPILLITSIVYWRYYTTTIQQMDEFAANTFDKAIQQTNDSITDIIKASNLFTFYSGGTSSLIRNLQPYADPSAKPTPVAVYQTKQNIKYICQNILNSYDFIYGLYVFTPCGVTIDYDNTKDMKLRYQYNPKKENWYQKTIQLKGELYISGKESHSSIFTGNKNSVFVSKYLYDVYSHRCLGVLLVNCDPKVFDLSTISAMPDLTTFAIRNTSTGSTIFSNENPQSRTIGGPHPDKILSSSLKLPALTLTATINYSQLYKEFNVTGILLIAIGASCLMIVLVLSSLLSRYVTQPIIDLAALMSEQKGSGLHACDAFPARTDEIGILYHEYNNMTEKLNTAIKTDYQNKLIALDSQMKSLEARINSHFLFNTLASFNSIAEIDGSERLATMSIALGNMFRYTIKTQSELVTIAEELNHVNDYVTIQSIRFSKRFTLKDQIPDAMKAYTVLKLILQPLVENAMIHGLKNCQTGSLILLNGRIENSYLYLSVSDDGQGMDDLKVSEIKEALSEEAEFTELGHRNNQSIGLKNIHSRIELYYGKGFGLTIESKLNKGTHVHIKIPVLDHSYQLDTACFQQPNIHK